MADLTASRSNRWLFRIARLRVTLGFVMAPVAFLLADPTYSSIALGGLVGAGGEALRVWAAGHVRKSEEVTSSGPYRFTRHPLYVGSGIVGVGFAVAAASLVVAALVLGYLAVVLWVAITVEEAALRDKFGSTYDGYASGTREASSRPFSLEQAVRNGEHRALLGFIASLGLLSLKVWFGSSV
jgi:protein-S-isoprenylcysteine O-methyltransferase Ste14